MSRTKLTVNSAGKIWKLSLRQSEVKDFTDEVQPQRIGGEIIRPRDRAAHGICAKSYAELQGDLQKAG